eukprot:scaffold343452_cov17-Prasinocladus_malaysianus.AAC.1
MAAVARHLMLGALSLTLESQTLATTVEGRMDGAARGSGLSLAPLHPKRRRCAISAAAGWTNESISEHEVYGIYAIKLCFQVER